MGKKAAGKTTTTFKRVDGWGEVKRCLVDPETLSLVTQLMKKWLIGKEQVAAQASSRALMCSFLTKAEDLVENTRRDTPGRARELAKIRDVRRRLEMELYP